MDDILQFLLIAGIIVIGIVKQFKKEAKRTLTTAPLCPCRTLTLTMTHCPFPKAGGKTYGGYIPEGPRPEPKPVSTAKEEYQFSSSKHIFGGDPANTSPKPITAPPKQKISPPPSVQQKARN